MSQAKKEPDSFFITHPTRFEKAPEGLELVPHPSPAKSACQVKILKNDFATPLFLFLAEGALTPAWRIV
jgi:hypothetical protein